MNRLAWVTDPHLEWLSERERQHFYKLLCTAPIDAVMISGDISTYSKLGEHLLELQNNVGLPIFFVLGNHDYYGSSFAHVRSRLTEMLKGPLAHSLRWLTIADPIILTPKTILVGHDGWACGTAGLKRLSTVELQDYLIISDFMGMSLGKRFDIMKREALRSVKSLITKISGVYRQYEHVIILTHAPPFVEASMYDGHISDAEFLPHFCNKLLGDALVKEFGASKTRISIFCGHTHHEAYATVTPNIAVKVGHAVYGNPYIQEIIEADTGC